MAEVQFDYTPSYGSSSSVQPRINLTRFGDGYVQRGANGINIFPEKWNVSFDMLTDADALGIEEKLKEAAGGTLLWKPPPVSEGDPYRKWICIKWDRRRVNYNVQSISLELEEVFE
jgi:phage-related protein